MLWILIQVASVWCGYEIVNLLAPPKWDQLTILSVGIPLGIAVISWLFFFIRFFASLTASIALAVSIATFVFCYFVHRQNQKPIHFRRFEVEFIFFFFLLSLLFYSLCDVSFLKDGYNSSGTVFSDLPFHLSLISSFSYGGNSLSNTMWTPFYLKSPLCYPIIPDFFSSVLVGCGRASLRVSVAVPSMLLLLSLLFLLQDLAQTYSRRRIVPEVTILCFVLASGVGWKWMLGPECRADVNANMAHCFCKGKETFWIHSVVHYLLPQRSGLFSIGICIAVTLILVHEIDIGLKDSKALLLAGIITGLLPCISAHSFLGAGEYALFICIFNFPWRPFSFETWKRAVLQWAIFGGTALVLAIPQTVWLMRMKRRDFFVVLPIWIETNSKFGFFDMWWESLGAFFVLAIANVWPHTSEWQRLMYYPSIAVFVVSNFLRYQPGAMDNTKVYLCAWYPLACCAVAHCLVDVIMRCRRWVFLVALSIVVSFTGFSISSVVCLYKALTIPFAMFDIAEMNFGLWVMENTRPDAAMLAAGWHASPMMSLAGRLITMGYGGWVWSHGLDYGARERWIADLVRNRENVTRFVAEGISYAVGKEDGGHNAFPPPPPYSRWMPVVEIKNARLYRLLRT
jgi:hypothetical protein